MVDFWDIFLRGGSLGILGKNKRIVMPFKPKLIIHKGQNHPIHK